MASSISSHGLPADWQTKSNPPAENTFTTDAPARLQSRLGTFEVDGTGAGRWGPLRFDAAGGMSGLPTEASGVVTIAVSNGAHGFVDVTFPTGRFTKPPLVHATKQSDGLAKFVPYVKNVTTAGFRLGIFAGDSSPWTASIPVAWLARETS